MGKYLVILCGASLAALGFPSAFEEYRRRVAAEAGVEQLAEPDPVTNVAAPPEPSPGTTTLRAGADGHFRAQARVNDRPIEVLVDTGATYVAMSETTARRLGLVLAPGDFRHASETANGRVRAALATLDRVRIGTVEVRHVEATITEGDTLNTVLLGMSFMGRLKRYDVSNDTLTLMR